MEKIISKSEAIALIRKQLPLSLFVKGAGETNTGYRCNCPLPGHSDPHTSFNIDSQKNLYFCYGCQRGGNIFTYLKTTLGFEEDDVIECFMKHNLIQVDLQNYDEAEEKNNTLIFELLERVTSLYQSNLKNLEPSQRASLQPLLERLGIDEEIENKYRIGWASDDVSEILKLCKNEKEIEALKQANIFKSFQNNSPELRFENRLIVPMLDRDKNPIAFQGHTYKEVSSSNPRVVLTPTTALYNSWDFLYGEFSTFYQSGFPDQVFILNDVHKTWPFHKAEKCAVALSYRLSKEQLQRIKRHSRTLIFVLGKQFHKINLKNVRFAYDNGLNVMILPEGKITNGIQKLQDSDYVCSESWFSQYQELF